MARHILKRYLPLFVAFSLGVAGGSFTTHASRKSQSVLGDASLATNAAYRDGLYLGKLDAERAAEPHISIGRWNTQSDRTSFAAGYNLGYQQEKSAMQQRP
jgi:hypothetical protein